MRLKLITSHSLCNYNLRLDGDAPKAARQARDMPPLRGVILGSMRRDPDMPLARHIKARHIRPIIPSGVL